jgi:hypothetical protein
MCSLIQQHAVAHHFLNFFENERDFMKNVRIYVTAEASSLRKYDPNFQFHLNQ